MSHTCRICKADEKNEYVESIKNLLEIQQVCFTCNFWIEKMHWKADHDPNCVIVEGKHYHISPDQKPDNGRLDNPRRFSGFGGSRFEIEWLNPHRKPARVVSHNLWCQGAIPEHFRKFLPDNARFVKEG